MERRKCGNSFRPRLASGLSSSESTYAMYHVPAAQVLSSQTVDLVLMLAVAAAMVFHTLRYRSQVVTGLAFDFLGYTFRPRGARNRSGELFVSFIPAVSDRAATAMRSVLRRWKLSHRDDLSLEELMRWLQPVVRGWVNYYGRFYPSALPRAGAVHGRRTPGSLGATQI